MPRSYALELFQEYRSDVVEVLLVKNTFVIEKKKYLSYFWANATLILHLMCVYFKIFYY